MVRSKGPKKSDSKFEKKLEFYSKVRESVVTLSATKAIEKKNKNARKRQKKLKAYDFSNLADILPELNAKQRPPAPTSDPRKNCKSRQKLVVQEANRLMTVLSNPAFQSDPVAAIHQHLQSTQPALETKPKKKSNQDAKRKRKKKSKTSLEPQSMEM